MVISETGLSSQSLGYGTKTYNNQVKYKKPQKLNQTNPGLVASYDIQPGNGSGLF